MKAPLILIDGSSYFFRAFHALPPLTNSKGQPTGAIYGVVNMVKRLRKDNPLSRIAIVFDAKGKTFRHDWYVDYKAHRPPMPNELSSQFKPMLQILEAMGLPILIVDGVEADDVIGTLAKHAQESAQEILISTGDKDMVQLVNEHVTLINTMTNQILDTIAVHEKFGILPSQFIDYLTLIGDSSDNIPGVPNCGPKTALKWLSQYDSLDNILANMDKIGGKIGQCLRDSAAHLPLSKKLVTIKTDIELPLNLHELIINAENKEALIALTAELEFKR